MRSNYGNFIVTIIAFIEIPGGDLSGEPAEAVELPQRLEAG